MYVDADNCPMKDEVYRVAGRHKLEVYVVSHERIRTPQELRIVPVVVEAGPKAADKWIADHARQGDVVITGDVPLAERAVKTGARALHPSGRLFKVEDFANAPGSRSVAAGPTPVASAEDRTRFAKALDEVVLKAQRGGSG